MVSFLLILADFFLQAKQSLELVDLDETESDSLEEESILGSGFFLSFRCLVFEDVPEDEGLFDAQSGKGYCQPCIC